MENFKAYYENKVAVVTGGASGIGLALCEMLLACNARSVILADLNAEKLEAESKRLNNAHPGKALGIQTDVTRQESVQAAIKQAASFGNGEVHFLFNNAGLGLNKLFEETSDADWKLAFDINFYGPLHGIRAVLPIMRAQGGGHIANTASGIAFSPMAVQSMYAATKAALLALTTALRYEFWDQNIRFTTIIPGSVATPIWDKVGGAPTSAIQPEESARGILAGLAANERVVIVTEPDRAGARNSYDPDKAEGMDAYLLKVARSRLKGEWAI